MVRLDIGLGTGELRELIQDAVQESVSPIEEHLDLIESNMRQLPEETLSAEELDVDSSGSSHPVERRIRL